MANRDELFRRFGPLLKEALMLEILDQINILRTKAGLPTITADQAMTAIENRLNTLLLYDWME